MHFQELFLKEKTVKNGLKPLLPQTHNFIVIIRIIIADSKVLTVSDASTTITWKHLVISREWIEEK